MKKLFIATLALGAFILSAGPGRADLLIKSVAHNSPLIFTIDCDNFHENVNREGRSQFQLGSNMVQNCTIAWSGSSARLPVSDGEVYHFQDNEFTRVQ